MSRIWLLPIAVLAVTLAPGPAADWTRFRGPNGTGIAEGELPKIDPKKPLWKVEIPGRGAGSPVVIGGKVFLQTASSDGRTRTLLCFNAADGKKMWEQDASGMNAKMHAKNTLASATPVGDGEAVFCVWWDGSGVSLHAYDTTGKDKWQASLGGYVSQHGPGMSPEFVRDELFRPLRTTKGDGHGIGAYQARELLRDAGGDLLVISKPKTGTTMRLILPSVRPGVAEPASFEA